MKVCTNCGREVVNGDKFCIYCGGKVEEIAVKQGYVCPGCGKEYENEQLFCNACGTRLVSKVEQTEASADEPQKNTCANCGAELFDGASFCKVCGTKVGIDTQPPQRCCPNCGAQAQEDEKFCAKCGSKIDVQVNRKYKACIKCGEPLMEAEIFCSACGAAQNNATVGKKKGKNKGVIALIIILSVLVVAGGVLAFILFGDKPADTPELPQQSVEIDYAPGAYIEK